MGKFLTDKSRLGQTNIEGIWYTLDNQLYKDDDGTIYLTPRNSSIFNSVCWWKI